MDGDRDELINIRNDLTVLKQSSLISQSNNNFDERKTTTTTQRSNDNNNNNYYNNYPESEFKTSSPIIINNINDQISIYQQAIQNIKDEINNLLATGLYNENEDEVILELKKNIFESEKQFVNNYK